MQLIRMSYCPLSKLQVNGSVYYLLTESENLFSALTEYIMVHILNHTADYIFINCAAFLYLNIKNPSGVFEAANADIVCCSKVPIYKMRTLKTFCMILL